ncbi:MAG: hypothetical protein AUK47_22350 [Deltaproteobacteria bacterium CG2_30_63_29]|nr:MAG: hypothetical protein AUK47_22350 [Deltaproteobacteria bacterium CG2_30_63_29]PIV98356.1 MAG: hypothetical protein COW42_15155 [Deltaproteobacteria bacterium CG17_big_fil_post_rev_8_21_14_2_50_63_7]PJB34231.1 MAG: hypothetical protein CO108_28835 [Deltaproteobacteria bacterium CG_4_9_14_3_um_filter_63_12]
MLKPLLIGLTVLSLSMGLTAQAEAQIPFDINVGLKGGANFSGVTKPGNKELNGQAYSTFTYPGFFGVGWSLGAFIEPRILELVGLEIGFIYEATNGSGDINDYPLTMYSNDLAIPIHVRVATPGMIKFVAGAGVDVIVPLSQDQKKAAAFVGLEYETLERTATTYFGFDLGIEIDAVVVKIPIEARGRWNPSMEDTLDPRVKIDSTNGNYYATYPNWGLQGEFMVGVVYPIDIL